MDCSHDNAEFRGVFSLVGHYYCLDCGKKFEPVDYHRLKGWPHVDLHRERLTPSKTFIRSLVRIVAIENHPSLSECFVHVVVPGFDPVKQIRIPLKDITINYHELELGKRLHARVNIGVEQADELEFRDWENE